MHESEYFIRKAAGMGHGTTDSDPDSYEKKHVHCDILVVGGGPTGISAALTAGRSGARVILVDNANILGGQLNTEVEKINDQPAQNWVSQSVAELESIPNVRISVRTMAFGYYDSNVVNAIESVADHLLTRPPFHPRQRLWQIRAKRVVLATGATERPIVFRNNDRPGIMLASAARKYINYFAVKPGNRAVVFANNDDGYKTAFDLSQAGVELQAVVDSRNQVGGDWEAKLKEKDIEHITGSAVINTHGYLGLTGVDVAALSSDLAFSS